MAAQKHLHELRTRRGRDPLVEGKRLLTAGPNKPDESGSDSRTATEEACRSRDHWRISSVPSPQKQADLPEEVQAQQETALRPGHGQQRLASRFYQLKTGHALTGEYPHQVTKSWPSACWWSERRRQT